MGNDELSPARAGSGSDISRRLERVEVRQDEQAKDMGAMRETISRVESNQQHSEELNALRHESLKTGLDTLSKSVGQFMGRIEGIIDGTIQTAQTRQGAQIVADYMKWHDTVDEHIRASERIHETAAGKQEGISFVLTGTKAAILTACSVGSLIIAILVGVTK